MATTNEPQTTSPSSSRIESRSTVSPPDRVIQVEQVRISELQKSSIASAIRAGRALRDD